MAFIPCIGDPDSVHFQKISNVGVTVDLTQYLPERVWSKLTVNNFAVETGGAGSSWSYGTIADNTTKHVSYGYTAISKSYDAGTGILTLNRPNAHTSMSSDGQGSYWDNTSYCTKTLYVFW